MEIKAKFQKFGFTLLELLIGMAIFSSLAVSITALSLYIIADQRKIFSIQSTREAGQYILESVGKEIRTCSSVVSFSQNGDTLNIINSDGDSVIYAFAGGALQRNGQPISPANIGVTGAFYVRNYVFPKRILITLFIKLNSLGGKGVEQSEINLESTIAPRQ